MKRLTEAFLQQNYLLQVALRSTHFPGKSRKVDFHDVNEIKRYTSACMANKNSVAIDGEVWHEAITIDYRRGVALLDQGDVLSARQAFLEQARVNDNMAKNIWKCDTLHEGQLSTMFHITRHCWNFIYRIESKLNETFFNLPDEIEAAEPHFALVYHGIVRYTMLHWPRLLNIWRRIRELGNRRLLLPQNSKIDKFCIVDAGVAAGGSTVLMAVASHLYLGKWEDVKGVPPKVLAFDTFRGMPPVGNMDYRCFDKVTAQSLGWGEGTCSSGGSTEIVTKLATQYNVNYLVDCISGDFSDTLPAYFTSASEPRNVIFAHLDSDWYDSTRLALRYVYPAVINNVGEAQIDDYNYWNGSRRAVDEYFALSTKNYNNNILKKVPYDDNARWITKQK